MQLFILSRDDIARATPRVGRVRWSKIAAIALMAAVTACGPSQAEIEAQRAKEAAAQAAERKALAKAADDRKRSACEGAIEVAQSFLSSARSLQSEVEAAHSSAIEKTRLGYERTIGNEIYEMSGAGVGAAIDLKNAYNNARIQSLEEQKGVLQSFIPLENAFGFYAQARKVASAGGAAFETVDVCKHAKTLMKESNKTLDLLARSTKSVAQEITENRQVIEAANNRLSEALR
jgi:hypothetical protein